MKRRIRPLLHPLHQPMFDQIEMDVIDATFEVTVVAYLMFPKTPLPKINFPALDPRCAARLDRYQQMFTAAADMGFNHSQAFAERHVILWQGLDRV